MNTVKVEEAVGMILAHDLTKIVPGQFKGAAFKKGHVIRPEDIKELKSMGKNHINIQELKVGYIHENEAALRIAGSIAGSGTCFKDPSEGKVEIKARHRGIVKIDIDALNRINEVDKLIVTTIHTNTLVEEGQVIAATRIIPLVIEEKNILMVEAIGASQNHSVVTVREIKPKKVGLVITGTEVYEGRIKDGFAPVMKEKIKYYGCSLSEIRYCPDNKQMIEKEIQGMLQNGTDIVLACGGMSVDADDVTPLAIGDVSETVVSYGIPAIPGNMLMMAYKENAVILGIPGAAIFMKNTSLDLILPRILAGERLSKKDLLDYAHGGLCLGCRSCIYPMCPFGK